VFSAQSEGTLKEYAALLAEAACEWLDDDLTAICATAARRRTHLQFRRVIVARSVAELRAGLMAVASGDCPSHLPDAAWSSWARRFELGEPVPLDAFPAAVLPGRVDWPPRPWDHRSYWIGNSRPLPSGIDTGVPGIVAAVLGSKPANLDPGCTLIQLGLDSLMALELSDRVREAYGARIPPAELLNGMRLSDLARVSETAAEWEEARV
jgi:acyl transferase domain-containing protein